MRTFASKAPDDPGHVMTSFDKGAALTIMIYMMIAVFTLVRGWSPWVIIGSWVLVPAALAVAHVIKSTIRNWVWRNIEPSYPCHWLIGGDTCRHARPGQCGPKCKALARYKERMAAYRRHQEGLAYALAGSPPDPYGLDDGM